MSQNVEAATFYSRNAAPGITGAGANWGTLSTWSTTGHGGIAAVSSPTATDEVIIASGHIVLLNGAFQCNSLTISPLGVLRLGAGALTINGIADIYGTINDDNGGGTTTFKNTLTVYSGGTLTTSNTGTSTFIFEGNIINSGIFDLGNAGHTINYTFQTASLTITPNSNMRFGQGGAGQGTLNTNVTVLNGNGNVEFLGNLADAPRISSGATLTNQNGGTGILVLHRLNILGGGTFINGTNAVVAHRSTSAPSITGVINLSAVPNKFIYEDATTNIAAITYYDLEIGGPNIKTLIGNVTVNGSFTLLSGTNPFKPLNNNFTVVGSSTIHGFFDDDSSGGTNTFNSVTITNTGRIRDLLSGGTNTYIFQGVISNSGEISSNPNVANTSVFTFQNDIINNAGATFALNNNGTYNFNKATPPLIVTPTANMSIGFTSGGGTANIHSDVSFDNSGGTIAFNGSVLIAAGKTLTNNIGGANDLRFNFNGGINGATGTSTFINNDNARLTYSVDNLPMATGVFDVDADNNTVSYSRMGDQNIRPANYFHLELSSGGPAHTKTLTNNTTVLGNLTIWGSQTMDLQTHNLTLEGNLVNNKGASNCFAGTGNVIFWGANPRNITNNIDFYNLTLNTTSTVTLSTSSYINVANTLTLTSGKLILGDNNITLTGAPSAQLAPAVPTSTSYIVTDGMGKLFRNSLDASVEYFFPVGNTTLKMVSCSLTVAGSAGARYIEGTLTAPYAPPAGAYDVINGRWDVNAGISTDPTFVRFYNTGNTNPLSFIQKHNGSVWEQVNTDILFPDYRTGSAQLIGLGASFTIFSFLAIPNALTATNVTKNNIEFNCETITGADGYILQYSTTSDFSSGNVVLPGVGTMVAITPALNTIYYYRFKAYKNSPYFETPYGSTKMTSTHLPAGSGRAINTADNKYISFPSHEAINFANGYVNKFTLQTWVKPTVLAGVQGILCKAPSGISDGFALYTSGGTLRFETSGGSLVAPVSFVAGKAYQITITHDEGASPTTEMYINGVLATSGDVAVTTSGEDLKIGVMPDDDKAFNGQIDEVRLWSVVHNIDYIRNSLCSKIDGLNSDLVGYFRFDEPSGNLTENKAMNASLDAVVVDTPLRITSNIPLGDISVSRYGYSDGTLDTDAFSINNFSATPVGFHIYKVNEAPNFVSPPSVYGTMLDSRYWGVFVADGTSPTFDIAYSYTSNTQVTRPNALRFAKRDEVNDDLPPVWKPYGGVNNGIAKKATRRKAEAGEFILAQKNFSISNALNGGTMINSTTGAGGIEMSREISGDFTVEFWAWMEDTGTSSGNWKVGKRYAGSEGGTNNFGISLMAGNNIVCGLNTATTPNNVNTVLLPNKWYHIAMTRTKSATGVIKLYINGKEVSTVSETSDVFLNASNMHIGQDNAGSNNLKLKIDEFRVWDTALTESTIKDYMNLRANDGHSNYDNLINYYRFDENTGTTSEDLLNGNDATLLGGATWASSDQALGDGYKDRQNASTSNGTVSFGTMVNAASPQVEVTFGVTPPNGELVCTRVSAAPNNYPPSSGSIGGANNNVAGWSGVTNFMNCYWVIRNYGTNSTFSPIQKIKFQIPTGNTVNILNPPSSLLLFKRPTNSTNQADWRLVGIGTAWGSIEFAAGGPTDIDQWSELVIGSSSTPLGVTLTEFKGKRLGDNTVQLEWNTLQEKENAGFEIQRSADGKNFTQIGFLDGKGNTNALQNYVYTDNKAEGNLYYRLLQTDRDGTSTYSPVVYVKAEVGRQELTLYPNPTYKILNISVLGAVNGTMRAEVWDTQGKLVWEGKGNLKEIENSLNITLGQWKEGTYLFRLYSPDKTLERKFIKRK